MTFPKPSTLKYKIKTVNSGSSGNCYILDIEGDRLILECGVTINEIKKAIEFDLTNIHGCLISHSHTDHAKSIRDITKTGITVYTNEETLTRYKMLGEIKTTVIEPEKWVKINDTFNIYPFQLFHDVTCYGYYIVHIKSGMKIFFATDTYAIEHTFPSPDILMIECNYSERVLESNYVKGSVHYQRYYRTLASHMELEHLIDYLSKCDVSKIKEVMLLHLSGDNANEKEMVEKVKEVIDTNIYIARPKLVVKKESELNG